GGGTAGVTVAPAVAPPGRGFGVEDAGTVVAAGSVSGEPAERTGTSPATATINPAAVSPSPVSIISLPAVPRACGGRVVCQVPANTKASTAATSRHTPVPASTSRTALPPRSPDPNRPCARHAWAQGRTDPREPENQRTGRVVAQPVHDDTV